MIIDADTEQVARRVRQLDEALTAEDLPRRGDQETVVHLIPKRNIETWILNLNGEQVDEDADHHDTPGIDEQINTAARTLFELTRPNAVIPDICVPSLRSGITELKRIEQNR